MTEQFTLKLINQKMDAAKKLIEEAMEIADEANVKVSFVLPNSWSAVTYYPESYDDSEEYGDYKEKRKEALQREAQGRWLSSTDECNIY